MAGRKVFVRTPYNYDVRKASIESGLKCEGPGRTIQSQRDEADINVIVRRFGLTGQMPVSVRLPKYGDFEAVNDYQSALNAVKEASDSFMAIPADVRAKFDNSPQRFLEFVSKPENIPAMREMGLMKPEEKKAPVKEAS